MIRYIWLLGIWVAKGTTSKEMVETTSCSNKLFMIKFPEFFYIESTYIIHKYIHIHIHTHVDRQTDRQTDSRTQTLRSYYGYFCISSLFTDGAKNELHRVIKFWCLDL
jgi:hypothetical protein